MTTTPPPDVPVRDDLRNMSRLTLSPTNANWLETALSFAAILVGQSGGQLGPGDVAEVVVPLDLCGPMKPEAVAAQFVAIGLDVQVDTELNNPDLILRLTPQQGVVHDLADDLVRIGTWGTRPPRRPKGATGPTWLCFCAGSPHALEPDVCPDGTWWHPAAEEVPEETVGPLCAKCEVFHHPSLLDEVV